MTITINALTLFVCGIVSGFIARGIVALVKNLLQVRDKEPKE